MQNQRRLWWLCCLTKLLLLLALCLSNCCQAAGASGSSRSCSYRQVQQMFDLAKHGQTGCIKLRSLTYIFGSEAEASPKLTAARFVTANLVFTGTVVHVVKDPASVRGTDYSVRVLVHCYLKGRLSSREVTLTGLQTGESTGLCLDVSCQDGDTGLFFATYIGPDEIRINENGFIKEGPMLDAALRTLRCRENFNYVSFWPASDADSAPAYCRRIDPDVEASCGVSIGKAQVYLGHVFINFERDLKPECQEGKDAVMRRIFLPPVSSMPAFSRMSSYGNGASGASGRWAAIATAVLTVTAAFHRASDGGFGMMQL